MGGVNATQYLECKGSLVPTGLPWIVRYTNAPPTAITNTVLDFIVTNRMYFYRMRVTR